MNLQNLWVPVQYQNPVWHYGRKSNSITEDCIKYIKKLYPIHSIHSYPFSDGDIWPNASNLSLSFFENVHTLSYHSTILWFLPRPRPVFCRGTCSTWHCTFRALFCGRKGRQVQSRLVVTQTTQSQPASFDGREFQRKKLEGENNIGTFIINQLVEIYGNHGIINRYI